MLPIRWVIVFITISFPFTNEFFFAFTYVQFHNKNIRAADAN